MTVRDEQIDNMTADEPRTAGDECFHGTYSIPCRTGSESLKTMISTLIDAHLFMILCELWITSFAALIIP
jgi:hypothetical protein